MEVEKIADLIEKAKEGDKKSQAMLHEHYDGLFKYYADKFARKYSKLVEFDDLVQEAHIGLLKAVRNFNPDKVKQPMSITTYVYFYMLDALQSACDYKPTDLAISIHGDTEKDNAECIADDLDLEDEILSNEIIKEELEVRRQYLDSLLTEYDPRDKAIIKLRLGVTNGVPRTLSEIAEVLNMGIETVRIRERAILGDILSHRVTFRRV